MGMRSRKDPEALIYRRTLRCEYCSSRHLECLVTRASVRFFARVTEATVSEVEPIRFYAA
jgi:DNA-directed RNA polymerase subunit RPC12/RpoP